MTGPKFDAHTCRRRGALYLGESSLSRRGGTTAVGACKGMDLVAERWRWVGAEKWSGKRVVLRLAVAVMMMQNRDTSTRMARERPSSFGVTADELAMVRRSNRQYCLGGDER